jgi:hypothetical protein
VRFRVRCASPACGRRITVKGRVRDRRAEADRRRTFAHALAALTPLVGVARARDRAIEISGIHLSTASRHMAVGSIAPEFRQGGHTADYYSMVEGLRAQPAQAERLPGQ